MPEMEYVFARGKSITVNPFDPDDAERTGRLLDSYFLAQGLGWGYSDDGAIGYADQKVARYWKWVMKAIGEDVHDVDAPGETG